MHSHTSRMWSFFPLPVLSLLVTSTPSVAFHPSTCSGAACAYTINMHSTSTSLRSDKNENSETWGDPMSLSSQHQIYGDERSVAWDIAQEINKCELYEDEQRVAWDIAQELNDIEDPDHTM